MFVRRGENFLFLFSLSLFARGRARRSACVLRATEIQSGFCTQPDCSSGSIYFSTAAQRVTEAESHAVTGSVDPCTINLHAPDFRGAAEFSAQLLSVAYSWMLPHSKAAPPLCSPKSGETNHFVGAWEAGTIFSYCVLSWAAVMNNIPRLKPPLCFVPISCSRSLPLLLVFRPNKDHTGNNHCRPACEVTRSWKLSA